MVLKRDHLLVMGMNPLRGPHSWFMDGDYSWDLSLGTWIGDGKSWWGDVLGRLWMVFLGGGMICSTVWTSRIRRVRVEMYVHNVLPEHTKLRLEVSRAHHVHVSHWHVTHRLDVLPTLPTPVQKETRAPLDPSDNIKTYRNIHNAKITQFGISIQVKIARGWSTTECPYNVERIGSRIS